MGSQRISSRLRVLEPGWPCLLLRNAVASRGHQGGGNGLAKPAFTACKGYLHKTQETLLLPASPRDILF